MLFEEEITTLIDNQVPSMKNFEVPDLDDLDLQIIDLPDAPEKLIEVIEIEDEPDNQSKFFKCPLCTEQLPDDLSKCEVDHIKRLDQGGNDDKDVQGDSATEETLHLQLQASQRRTFPQVFLQYCHR